MGITSHISWPTANMEVDKIYSLISQHYPYTLRRYMSDNATHLSTLSFLHSPAPLPSPLSRPRSNAAYVHNPIHTKHKQISLKFSRISSTSICETFRRLEKITYNFSLLIPRINMIRHGQYTRNRRRSSCIHRVCVVKDVDEGDGPRGVFGLWFRGCCGLWGINWWRG